VRKMNRNLHLSLLFLSLILLICQCSSVRGEFDWLTPGSYAIYELNTSCIIKLNETYLRIGSPTNATVARYGFTVVKIDGNYALLYVSLNESSVLPVLFDTSSLSCLVWVDLETRDLVDRDTGEVWGKCPFWIYPWEAGANVTAFGLLNMTLMWDYVSLGSEASASEGIYSPTHSFLTPIGYFNEFDFIAASYGNKPDPTYITLGTHSFPLSFQSLFHVEKGLLLISDSNYIDDVLAKKFSIAVCQGSLGRIEPDYSQENIGWIVGCMIIYDTNILRGSDVPTVGGGFPLYVPLLIGVIVLVPLAYYVYVRRLSKRRS